MRGTDFYSIKASNTRNKKGQLLQVAVFLFVALLPGIHAIATPIINNPPVFTNGHAQVYSVCESSTFTPIDSLLSVTDIDHGQTETWTVLSAPTHGTLSGFSTTALSNGSVVTPSFLFYTPDSGYTGIDTFSVEVFDGFDTSTTTIYITAKLLPTLTSTLSPTGICSGSLFAYNPSSATTGATFSWSRPVIGGITDTAKSDTGNVREILTSVTYYQLPVTYTFAISANGCTNYQDVVVDVNPIPRLTSSTTDTVCSGAPVNYTLTATPPGAIDSWYRPGVVGISQSIGTGSGNINESLTNTTSGPVNVIYYLTLSANGCNSFPVLTVTVDLPPTITTIATSAPTSVCAGTNYQDFAAAIPPPPGVTYSWSAVNATIFASSGQNAIVNFPNAGTAVVTLNCAVGVSGCVSSSSVSVNVGSGQPPVSRVLYYNSSFLYLDNDVNGFQWGYDDAGTLMPNLIVGATFQTYPDNNPDFANKYYWVNTSLNGCTQKTYYNAPATLGVANVNAAADIKAYPNPASNSITVSVDNVTGTSTEVSLKDMMGRVLSTQSGTGNTFQFDVKGLADGNYLVSYIRNGISSTATRITVVKN